MHSPDRHRYHQEVFKTVILQGQVQNEIVNHPMQTFEWGEFRRSQGDQVIRVGFDDQETLTEGFQFFIRPLGETQCKMGYLPKGSLPDECQLELLRKIGRDNQCVAIKIELDVPETENLREFLLAQGCHPARSIFSENTFQIDLTLSEEELLMRMHPKTRYNIHLAQRKGVRVAVDNSEEALETFLALLEETKSRQKFEAPAPDYYRRFWDIFKPSGMVHLIKALRGNEVYAMAMIFIFKNKIYYPHGVSTRRNRELMASNFLMWEVIRFAKQNQCTIFDAWSASDFENLQEGVGRWGADRFLLGFGARLIKLAGSYDLIFNS